MARWLHPSKIRRRRHLGLALIVGVMLPIALLADVDESGPAALDRAFQGRLAVIGGLLTLLSILLLWLLRALDERLCYYLGHGRGHLGMECPDRRDALQ